MTFKHLADALYLVWAAEVFRCAKTREEKLSASMLLLRRFGGDDLDPSRDDLSYLNAGLYGLRRRERDAG